MEQKIDSGLEATVTPLFWVAGSSLTVNWTLKSHRPVLYSVPPKGSGNYHDYFPSIFRPFKVGRFLEGKSKDAIL